MNSRRSHSVPKIKPESSPCVLWLIPFNIGEFNIGLYDGLQHGCCTSGLFLWRCVSCNANQTSWLQHFLTITACFPLMILWQVDKRTSRQMMPCRRVKFKRQVGGHTSSALSCSCSRLVNFEAEDFRVDWQSMLEKQPLGVRRSKCT